MKRHWNVTCGDRPGADDGEAEGAGVTPGRSLLGTRLLEPGSQSEGTFIPGDVFSSHAFLPGPPVGPVGIFGSMVVLPLCS